MSGGVAAEVATWQRPAVRHTQRLARLFDRLSERPVGRMPTACHGWAEAVAASHLLPNPRSDAPEIVTGHTHATRQRLRAQEGV
jgi:transposase-like protein